MKNKIEKLKKESKTQRIKYLEAYIQGMKDALFYLNYHRNEKRKTENMEKP